MLSYRHAFHAGNHADVLKHLVLVQVLRYMGQKDKPYRLIDTHAGAGGYAQGVCYAVIGYEIRGLYIYPLFGGIDHFKQGVLDGAGVRIRPAAGYLHANRARVLRPRQAGFQFRG